MKSEAAETEKGDLDATGAFNGRNQRLLIMNLLRCDGADHDVNLL